jgi:uncharacterized membrane protein
MNQTPAVPDHATPPASRPGRIRGLWHGIRGRILGGLLVALPILITLWVVQWLYLTLDSYVIDPIAQTVLWKIRGGQAEVVLPAWFEYFVAPLIAILIALGLLYILGFLARSRLLRLFNWILLRLPVISIVYNAVQKVFQTLEQQRGQQSPRRVVLIGFPHPGMKVPAFVTATCRDLQTQKVLLCVYVPTTPVPT